MNLYQRALNCIQDFLVECDEEFGTTTEFSEKLSLVGSAAPIDSMKLVELCLCLEELADDVDIIFDWQSDKAMSESRSIFKTVGSLAEYFSKAKKI